MPAQGSIHQIAWWHRASKLPVGQVELSNVSFYILYK